MPEWIHAEATMSQDGVYRYKLLRRFARAGPTLTWLMLNPSTADGYHDDATVRRCISFSDRWGAGQLWVVNLFALRSTDPRELRKHPRPKGDPDNLDAIVDCAAASSFVVCAWGNHGRYLERSAEVVRELRGWRFKLFHLGLTKLGEPKHPLYLPAASELTRWQRV